MVHLPQDRGEIVDDCTADCGRQIAPDVPRLDGHVPSLPSAVATSSSSASMLSLVCVVGRSLRGPRFVTCRGRSSVRPNRHSTRAQDSGHVDRSIEISRNRLPLSGCVASMTSISAEATSSSALGASLNALADGTRLGQPFGISRWMRSSGGLCFPARERELALAALPRGAEPPDKRRAGAPLLPTFRPPPF